MTDIEEFAEYLRSRLPPLQDLKVTSETVSGGEFEVRGSCVTPAGTPYSFSVVLPLDTPRQQVMAELDGMVGAVKDTVDRGFDWSPRRALCPAHWSSSRSARPALSPRRASPRTGHAAPRYLSISRPWRRTSPGDETRPAPRSRAHAAWRRARARVCPPGIFPSDRFRLWSVARVGHRGPRSDLTESVIPASGPSVRKLLFGRGERI